jgi:riboflavin biosynthesis pyrimidine reductase
MKTIVWATLTANGNYARASAAHPPNREALEDFAAHARHVGNFIVGRRTFEAFQSDASRKVNDAEQVFASVEIVVVSAHTPDLPGIARAATPADALMHLDQRGFGTALVAGGETLINAFLAQGLVDEVVFNFAPALEGEGGLRLGLPKDRYAELRLLELRDLGGGVGQLHYALDKRAA